jgi:hypothetical protein
MPPGDTKRDEFLPVKLVPRSVGMPSPASLILPEKLGTPGTASLPAQGVGQHETRFPIADGTSLDHHLWVARMKGTAFEAKPLRK